MIIPVHICSNGRRQVATRDQRGQASCDGRLYRLDPVPHIGLSAERLVCRGADGANFFIHENLLVYRQVYIYGDVDIALT